MNIELLKPKWGLLVSTEELNNYRAIRITSECIPDLFIGTDENGFRCLILFIPIVLVEHLNISEKEKLQIIYLKSKNVIIIRLNDPEFKDLFNDLIISLYQIIKDLEEPKEYSKQLVNGFYKWSEFFRDKNKNNLSPSEIKGLFGELFFLNEILKESNSESINRITESWKGPFDTTHDFIFETKNIEIKTKLLSKESVKISSEYQLELEFDKGLELLVISVIVDLNKGQSINDLLRQIQTQVRNNFGDLSILYSALKQKGLTIENTKQYNNYRYLVDHSCHYDCTKIGFPKLSFTTIPRAISKLNYSLRVRPLEDFIIKKTTYQNGN
jgi:putative PD-(D/E)XK family protein DUF4420